MASDALEPSVTFDGSQYSVAWRGVAAGQPDRILFRQMSATGTLLQTMPIGISESDFPSIDPAIVVGDDGLAIVWQEINDLESSILLRLVSSSLVLGERVELVAQDALASAPAIVRSDSSFGVAWQENRTGQAEVFFREFDFLGTPLSEAVQLSAGKAASNRPSLVYNGERFAASWQTGPTGTRVIRFRTIDVP